ncbi:histidine kinase [Microbacterium sp. LjRoot45]|uniref:sensor histidine kinase n=1 Tax=Microbacterium sp. LjRoot45 TaxID=3342329 RepID=UPI003ECDE64A
MTSRTPASSTPSATPAPGVDGAPVWRTLVTASSPTASRAESPQARRTFVRLGLGLLAVLLIVGVLAGFAAQWLAEREAVNDAANVTDVLADAVIQPSLTDELADGDPAALAAFDRIVRQQVLSADVVRVKIWSPDGVVIYADEPQLVGRTFELDDAQRLALSSPATRAEVSDLSEEENEFEAGPRLLEVYRPVWTPDGRTLLFEVYLPYEPVAARSADLWRGFAGVTTSSLLLLAALTAPIVWGLLRRLRTQEQRRIALLEHAVDASDAERRRIAGTLHDGPVQELVATTFAAEAAAGAAAARGSAEEAADLRRIAGAVRGNIRVLRSLLVDIYPESLQTGGLAGALHDLAATAHARGVEVRVEVEVAAGRLDDAQERLVYRIAQEALRNTVAHAAPCTATVRVFDDDGITVLEVGDDGRGFEPSILDEPPREGHLGTRVLIDLAAHEGAALRLATAPGAGTTWRLELPKQDAGREDAS